MPIAVATRSLHHFSESAKAAPATIPTCFFNEEDIADLGALLHRPYKRFIDICCMDGIFRSLQLTGALKADFAISLSTRSGYYLHLVEAFCKEYLEKLALGHDLYCDIKTCLQEAVSNALMHGNLGLKSDFFDAETLKNYHHNLHAQLYDDNGNKRVTLVMFDTPAHITFGVYDEGDGFDIGTLEESQILPHGRGLHLIRMLAHDAWQVNKQSLYMRFLKKT